MADQDIWLGGHIVLRIQTFGQEGANLICLSVSHVYFCVGGGAEVYSQTGWGNDRICTPLDPPLSIQSPIRISIQLSLRPSMRPSFTPSIQLFFRLSIHASILPSIHVIIRIFFHTCKYPSVYPWR